MSHRPLPLDNAIVVVVVGAVSVPAEQPASVGAATANAATSAIDLNLKRIPLQMSHEL